MRTEEEIENLIKTIKRNKPSLTSEIDRLLWASFSGYAVEILRGVLGKKQKKYYLCTDCHVVHLKRTCPMCGGKHVVKEVTI